MLFMTEYGSVCELSRKNIDVDMDIYSYLD